MMDTGNIRSEQAVDPLDNVDLDSFLEDIIFEDNLHQFLMNPGVDATTIYPNYPSQPFISTINGCTNLGGASSSNALQFGNSPEMMTVSGLTPSPSNNINPMQVEEMITVGRLTPSSITDTMHSEGIIYSAVKRISNISTQRNTDEPLLQQVSSNQLIPPAQGGQYEPLLQQVSSNQLVPCTGTMVNAPILVNLQNNQTLMRVQMQPNMNQNQLQLQQVTGNPGILISGGGRQQGNILYLNLSAPVGFATPSQFISSHAYHEYVLRQIRKLKDRYFNELLKMHYTTMEMRTMATPTEVSNNYEKAQLYLEKIMTFLNITRVEMIPNNDEMVYNYMNMIVNYMSYQMNRTGGYSLICEPAHQPLIGPQVQPLGGMSLQNNPSTNLSQRVTNLEANMLNFNQNFPSRRPQPRMPSSLNTTSFQASSFKAPQPSALSTTEQINSGPKTSNVIGSSSPTSLFTNTTATNFPSPPLNHQPSVVNQNFNLEKMKAPMHKTNEITRYKAPHGMSPLCSGLVNQCRPQFSPPPIVNPITQQTSVASSRFDVNSLLSPLSIAQSPFLLSPNSSAPSKQHSSRSSSLSPVDSQKTKPPMDPPSQESKTSTDHVPHLAEVVKLISSNALSSSLTDISAIEKVTNIIPDSVPSNIVGSYTQDDHAPLQKMTHKLSAPSETSANKRLKIENTLPILEEIKETNSKLLETSIHVVTGTSKDNVNTHEAHEGMTVKCLFKNVCFPELVGPQEGFTSEKMPEFVILILVPTNYPASSPKIIKSSHDVLKEPWGKLYEEMLTKFDLSIGGVTGTLSIGDMARNWDASAHAVMTEFMMKRDGKSFSSVYGSWDNCMNSSSTSK